MYCELARGPRKPTRARSRKRKLAGLGILMSTAQCHLQMNQTFAIQSKTKIQRVLYEFKTCHAFNLAARAFSVSSLAKRWHFPELECSEAIQHTETRDIKWECFVNTLQSLISLVVSVDAKHDVYFNTPSPSLISLVVSVDVKHHVYL